ncbi:MAG: hypothetical protein ACM3NH_02730 [Candidatus Saccharibacteria bacterium]
MRGLTEIIRMNELEAARALRERYKRLRARAVRRSDFGRARRYDGYIADFTRFLSGDIRVFPGPRQRRAGQFTPSAGREFPVRIAYPPEFKERAIRLDPGNKRLGADLAAGRPIAWWFECGSELDRSLRFLPDRWQQRQFEELRGYYRLLIRG